MGFFAAIKLAFSKAFTLRGRASRSEYWWFLIFGSVIQVALELLCKYVDSVGLVSMAAAVLSVVVFVFLLFFIIAFLTLWVRRLHDVDRSGWWIFLPLMMVPVGVALFCVHYVSSGLMSMNQWPKESWFVLLGTGVLAWLVQFYWSVKKGTIGSNRFGTDPLVR